MKSAAELQTLLRQIDHKSYPAYKDTRGQYQFQQYVLSIDHVQGDPFAAPSKVSLIVPGRVAGFDKGCYGEKHRRIAFQDYLLRRVAEATGLPVQLFLAHAQGGSQQIGARIAYDEIDMVLFFNDPTSDELDKDMSYIINLCDQHNVPIATNAASAEMLIHGLARGDLDWRLILKPTAPLKV